MVRSDLVRKPLSITAFPYRLDPAHDVLSGLFIPCPFYLFIRALCY